MTAYWVTGDTLETLRAMPSGSIDVVISSPPFLALRSYLPADDPAKAQEIGQEGTPGAFLDVLLDITEELRRVLAPHGSICIELGDTYSGSGGAGGDYAEGGMRETQPKFRQSGWHRGGNEASDRYRSEGAGFTAPNGGPGWPLDKSACLIPELYRMALAYGRNPLTGRECSRWRIRNTVRWVRPNPPVGALGDKFRPATSEMVIATMARDRYFDLDAVRTPHSEPGASRQHGSRKSPEGGDWLDGEARGQNPAGAPPLDWWLIPTAPYKGSHYATFPPALVEKPVKAMCPLKVCTVCGKPSERIVEVDEEALEAARPVKANGGGAEAKAGRLTVQETTGRHLAVSATKTTGWSDCGHNAWRTGRVLDIFGGSGTTLAVATGHGRDAIGIDLDARNVELARDRIGPMFFEHLSLDELVAMLAPRERAA